MVEYKCIRCGYIASQRSNMKTHLNRKNKCKPILETTNIESIKELYGFENINDQHLIDIQTTPKQHINDSMCDFKTAPKQHLNDTQLHLNDTLCVSKVIKYNNKICIHCNKTFTRKSGLIKHLNICKNKSEELVLLENNKITKMEKKIKELEEKNIKIEKKLKKQKYTNITNSNNINTTNTNITNNIIIKNFGEENIEHLQNNIYENLLQGIYTAVPKLIKLIHFDKNHPENQNIKFTNKKYPYLKIMKDNKWQLVNKNLEMRDLIDNKCYILNEKYYNILENQNELNDVQRSRIKQFMKKYNKDHKEVILDLINKTELILLNNS
jgi:hypothetical protein